MDGWVAGWYDELEEDVVEQYLGCAKGCDLSCWMVWAGSLSQGVTHTISHNGPLV